MSYFTDRWVLIRKEGTWGTWYTPNTFPNYLMRFDLTATENKSEEFVIGGARDSKKLVWLQEEVAGVLEQELVSGKIFEYILGSLNLAAGSASSWTITPGSTLPSFSLYRGIYPDVDGNTLSIGFFGCKVDNAELTLEQGEPALLEVSFVGQGATIPSAIAKPTIDYTLEGFSFVHGELLYEGGTISRLPRVVITINNNLEARFSAGAGTYTCQELREGGVDISGRLTVGGDLGTFETDIIGRVSGKSIQLTLDKTGTGANADTITIKIGNISFDELPSTATGLDPIEAELPFVGRKVTGGVAIEIIENAGTSFDVMPY